MNKPQTKLLILASAIALSVFLIYYLTFILQTFAYPLGLSLSESDIFYSVLHSGMHTENILLASLLKPIAWLGLSVNKSIALMRAVGLIIFPVVIFTALGLFARDRSSAWGLGLGFLLLLSLPIMQEAMIELNADLISAGLYLLGVAIVFVPEGIGDWTRENIRLIITLGFFVLAFLISPKLIYLLGFMPLLYFFTPPGKKPPIKLLITVLLLGLVYYLVQVFALHNINLFWRRSFFLENIGDLLINWPVILLSILIVYRVGLDSFNIRHPAILLIAATTLINLYEIGLSPDNGYNWLLTILGLVWIIVLGVSHIFRAERIAPFDYFAVLAFVIALPFGAIVLGNQYSLLAKLNPQAIKTQIQQYPGQIYSLDKSYYLYRSQNEYSLRHNSNLLESGVYSTLILPKRLKGYLNRGERDTINGQYLMRQTVPFAGGLGLSYVSTQRKYTSSEFLDSKYKSLDLNNLKVSF